MKCMPKSHELSKGASELPEGQCQITLLSRAGAALRNNELLLRLSCPQMLPLATASKTGKGELLHNILCGIALIAF